MEELPRTKNEELANLPQVKALIAKFTQQKLDSVSQFKKDQAEEHLMKLNNPDELEKYFKNLVDNVPTEADKNTLKQIREINARYAQGTEESVPIPVVEAPVAIEAPAAKEDHDLGLSSTKDLNIEPEKPEFDKDDFSDIDRAIAESTLEQVVEEPQTTPEKVETVEDRARELIQRELEGMEKIRGEIDSGDLEKARALYREYIRPDWEAPEDIQAFFNNEGGIPKDLKEQITRGRAMLNNIQSKLKHWDNIRDMRAASVASEDIEERGLILVNGMLAGLPQMISVYRSRINDSWPRERAEAVLREFKTSFDVETIERVHGDGPETKELVEKIEAAIKELEGLIESTFGNLDEVGQVSVDPWDKDKSEDTSEAETVDFAALDKAFDALDAQLTVKPGTQKLGDTEQLAREDDFLFKEDKTSPALKDTIQGQLKEVKPTWENWDLPEDVRVELIKDLEWLVKYLEEKKTDADDRGIKWTESQIELLKSDPKKYQSEKLKESKESLEWIRNNPDPDQTPEENETFLEYKKGVVKKYQEILDAIEVAQRKAESGQAPEGSALDPEKAARLEVLDREISDLERQLAELKEMALALPDDEESPEAKLARLEKEFEGTSKIRFRKRGKLETQVREAQKSVDRERNPLIYLIFDRISDRNIEIIFQNKRNNISVKGIHWLMGESMGEYVESRTTLNIEDKRDNAVEYTSNGFYIRIKNRKEVQSTKGVRLNDEKARFDLVGPDGNVVEGDFVTLEGARLELDSVAAENLRNLREEERRRIYGVNN